MGEYAHPVAGFREPREELSHAVEVDHVHDQTEHGAHHGRRAQARVKTERRDDQTRDQSQNDRQHEVHAECR